MVRRHVLALVPLTLLLPLAACGDDEGDDDGNADQEDTTGQEGTSGTAGEGSAPVSLEGQVNDQGTEQLSGGELQMEVADNSFTPTFVEGDAGATATVALTNAGDRRHTFTIDGTDVDVTLDPGASDEAEVTLPDSGSLTFYCRFHRNAGMQGALVAG
jgi:plastocyanin